MKTQSDLPSSGDLKPAIRSAGLRYVNDSMPGIRRRRIGKLFSYARPDGAIVRDAETLQRIRSLAIPPAYADVWISLAPNSYLQATGRDARGRKQYRYHPKWRQVRDETKYGRLVSFAEALPRIRRRVDQDLCRRGLERERVLATVVRLLERTHIRVGNEEYARQNGHYGLTTLRNKHVAVAGEKIHFHFVGKSGKKHSIDLRDRRLARIVARLRDLPGQELFQYEDQDGIRQSLDSTDVNQYIRETAREDFTAKDFRTWAGTVLAAIALFTNCEPCDDGAQTKKKVVEAIASVAERLGNTPSICRKCYIHPAIVDLYLQGVSVDRSSGSWEVPEGLDPEEGFVLRLLRGAD